MNFAEASTSQTSSREKIRGSPRFPHRIVPANSLGTISPSSADGSSRPHRWHSMEDAWKPKVSGTPRRSCSPNCDVWATQEVGIPLSELGNTLRGRRPPDYQALALSLTIPADSNISPDDGRLGSDLRKLFKESDTSGVVTPVDSEPRITKTTTSSTTTSPTALRISNAIAQLSRNNGSLVTLYAQENSLGVSNEDCARSQSPKVLVTTLDSPICETAEIVESELSFAEDQGPTAV